MIYAGIDEAGYGPLLGPMVIARSVFELGRVGAEQPLPSLWFALRSAVCRRISDSRKRVAVNDSKLLYTPARGMAHLERGVLSLLASAGLGPVASLDELLHKVAYDAGSRQSTQPWYADEAGGPFLPACARAEDLGFACDRLARATARTAVRLVDASAAVVFEDRFNRITGRVGSKAECAWGFVGGHLTAIWERFGEESPHVVIDRQGGRRYYAEHLGALFPQAKLETLAETVALNRYRISQKNRSLNVTIQVESEKKHLPAAYAAMAAKYIRELLMTRFRRYWQIQAPEVRPTFGYYGDGRRFLRELEPHLDRLAVDRRDLIRMC